MLSEIKENTVRERSKSWNLKDHYTIAVHTSVCHACTQKSLLLKEKLIWNS